MEAQCNFGEAKVREKLRANKGIHYFVVAGGKGDGGKCRQRRSWLLTGGGEAWPGVHFVRFCRIKFGSKRRRRQRGKSCRELIG